MVASGLAFGRLLANFSEIRLIQVVQGAAVMTMVLNSRRCGSRRRAIPSRASVAASTAKFQGFLA